MVDILKTFSAQSIEEERLNGARISVYFRWIFIFVLFASISVQLLHGFTDESIHSLGLIALYFIANTLLWIAVREKYDPIYLGYFSSIIDMGIISYHLYFLTSHHDYSAATAAASIFIYPIMFLLYTFRLNRKLLIFTIIIAITGFNITYYLNYFDNIDYYQSNLSLSPLSHTFKSVYIACIGLLCLYLQHSMSKFIEKHISEVSLKADLDAQVKIEMEKNRYAQELIEKEQSLNKNLENEIFEKEQIAKELKESREQLHSIMSNLVGAASRCLFDEHITVVYYSEKIFDITGYPASDFVNNSVRSFASIIHPDDDSYCREKIMEAHESKKPYEFEYRIIHKNGNIVWIKENGKCIFDKNGDILYLDGISIDITKNKETELAIQESERRYKELMDFLPQPIFELDVFGRVVFSNKAGDEFFGVTEENKTEKVSALDYFAEEDHPKIIQNLQTSNLGNETESLELTAIKKDKSRCPVIVFGTPIFRNNQIIGRRGLIIDISERKQYELSILKAKSELESVNSTLEQIVAERTKQLTNVNTQLLKLQKENLQSQFEVLKQQVNPHFLFNSLNVLTSLIKVDSDLAESFTEKLAKVYRYVLENKEKDVVSLGTELEFLNAYLFLLDIRFMKKILVEIHIDKPFLDYQVLPIAIQLIIENAIKHNTFSRQEPLQIKIFVDENSNLNITNNLNIRVTKFASTGVGLKNITKRYALITELTPEFSQTDCLFIAKLPLILPENND